MSDWSIDPEIRYYQSNLLQNPVRFYEAGHTCIKFYPIPAELGKICFMGGGPFDTTQLDNHFFFQSTSVKG